MLVVHNENTFQTTNTLTVGFSCATIRHTFGLFLGYFWVVFVVVVVFLLLHSSSQSFGTYFTSNWFSHAKFLPISLPLVRGLLWCCVVVRCVSSAIAPYYYGVGENHPSGKTNHPLCIAVDQCVARAWASVAVCVCGCW